MSELRRPLREVLRDTTPDAAEVERLWQGLQARRAPRRWIWLAAPAVAAALALVLLWPARDGGSGPLTLADGAPLAQVDAAAPSALAFRDGSRVELEAGASLRPLAPAGREVDLELRRGRARFALAPGRRWSIDAGGIVVQSSGARFAVWRGRDGVDVIVTQGEVTLRGERVPGLLQRLGAGASLHVEAAERPAATTAASEPAATQTVAGPAPAATPEAAGPVIARPMAEPRSPATPRRPGSAVTATPGPAPREAPHVASRTTPQAAPRAASRTTAEAAPPAASRTTPQAPRPAPAPPTPQAPPPMVAPTLDELLRQADAARLQGRPEDALPLLARAARDFPGDRRAAVAAFTRGRICADELRRPAAAAEAFAQALALGLPDALVETAYLRLVESRKAAGDGAGARAAAAEHRARYPRGRAAAQIERILGAP